MFAENLTSAEQRGLVQLVAYVALADGVLHPSEEAFVERLVERFSLESENWFDAVVEMDLKMVCGVFEREKARRVVFVELLNAAYADGDYGEAERRGLEVIARAMNLSANVVSELEQWVAAGVDWHRRGQELLRVDER